MLDSFSKFIKLSNIFTASLKMNFYDSFNGHNVFLKSYIISENYLGCSAMVMSIRRKTLLYLPLPFLRPSKTFDQEKGGFLTMTLVVT